MTFYIHVRAHERGPEFAVIGPYQTLADAVAAAEFARLPFWTVEQRDVTALRLFS